ncbi:MAG: hypothetical protein DA408_10620 [Bacteroidetes bacterium]|nr:MAG: hypothetical protein C7N36_11440 [Bacteroidota bacterium]PTM12407.1 MAG: hypothetical protein DA408_10620 [Bacteroidota bacterium]
MRTRITPEALTAQQYLRQIWRLRFLLLMFARRDVKIKYAQTYLGIGWALAQPALALAIFTVFFDYIIPLDTQSLPYVLFTFSGLVCWYFFVYIVNAGGLALLNNQDLLQKTYFPKLILPLAKILTGGVDFVVMFAALLVVTLAYGYWPTWKWLTIPLWIGVVVGSGACLAIWTSALSMRHRDVQHVIPVLVNFSIWVVPVFYPTTLIPAAYSWVLNLNPLVLALAGLRWALFDVGKIELSGTLGLVILLPLLLLGCKYFIKVEKNAVDFL